MDCPRCGSPMQAQTLEAHHARSVVVDMCLPCQSFWFDAHESLSLTPGATLALFRTIGERTAPAQPLASDEAPACPRCHAPLRAMHDMQRATKFSYLSCPAGHGRLTTFFDFLREKDFVRPLTQQQLSDLLKNVEAVQCSNCGARVDLARGASCTHCGSPLSMLDMKQAEALVTQLQRAEAREHRPIDPALPLELLRARRDTELAFGRVAGHPLWWQQVSTSGIVGAGLMAIARWLKGDEVD